MHTSTEILRRPATRHGRVGLYLSAEQRNRLKLYAAMLQAQHGRRVTQTEAVGLLLDMAGVPDAHRPEHA